MIKELIKLANELDGRGLTKEADLLDHYVFKIAGDDQESNVELSGNDVALDKSDIVRDAIDKSVGMPHFDKTFLTRNPGAESEGSIFSSEQSVESLKAATWEEYNHPQIMAPAKGYRTFDISGSLGLVELNDLNPQTPVEMVLGHKGETKFVSPIVHKSDVPGDLTSVEFTTILLGPGDDGHIVWTFHPGAPVSPSTMEPSDVTENVSTVAEAIDLGFQYGKVAAL